MKRKRYLIGYSHPSIRTYIPKRNKKKVAGMIALIGTCLVTPCTNWIIPVVAKLINEKNPLWIYK